MSSDMKLLKLKYFQNNPRLAEAYQSGNIEEFAKVITYLTGSWKHFLKQSLYAVWTPLHIVWKVPLLSWFSSLGASWAAVSSTRPRTSTDPDDERGSVRSGSSTADCAGDCAEEYRCKYGACYGKQPRELWFRYNALHQL